MLFSGVFTAEVAAARTDWRRAGGRGQDATTEPDYVQFYSEGENELFKEKVARIGSPILIIQGDEPSGLNRFNAEVLIPALEAAGKSVEVRTYPGEVHGFAFGDRSARPAMVLEAFEEVNAFFREAIPTAPTPIDSKFVEHVTLEERR